MSASQVLLGPDTKIRFTATRWASGRIHPKRRKPRRRVSYTLRVEGHWWQGGRWARGDDVDWSKTASTVARFTTAKRAWREWDRAPEPIREMKYVPHRPALPYKKPGRIVLEKWGTGSSGQRWRRWTYVAGGA